MAERTEEAILSELCRQTAYMREIASFIRRYDLSAALDDREKRAAYTLSDGSRSAQEIVDEAGLSKSQRTIQRWWKDWIDAGLAARTDSGSARARYDARIIDAEIDGD